MRTKPSAGAAWLFFVGQLGAGQLPDGSERYLGGIQTETKIVVDTTLVVIPVTVTDPTNRFVLGLEKEDFTIFEDGVQQKITQFSGEDAPLSVGIVIDTSGSMGLKMDTSHRAVTEFRQAAIRTSRGRAASMRP